jgi:hypothetical protein
MYYQKSLKSKIIINKLLTGQNKIAKYKRLNCLTHSKTTRNQQTPQKRFIC